MKYEKKTCMLFDHFYLYLMVIYLNISYFSPMCSLKKGREYALENIHYSYKGCIKFLQKSEKYTVHTTVFFPKHSCFEFVPR